jgi:hypothetical protein
MFAAAKRPLTLALLTSLPLLATVLGCGTAYDPTTALGKKALLDQASLALTNKECTTAIALMKPVYNSINTDNKIRMMMASAYGCDAHINLFNQLFSLSSDPGNLVGSGFWQFTAKEFPSTTEDRVVEGAQLALDAVQSVIEPGAAVLPENTFNLLTFNPGSYSVVDRSADANSYLFFVSMALIGGLESRYGSPFPNGKKGNDLPWINSDPTIAGPASAVTPDGCAYAAGVINFIDSLGGLAKVTTGTLSTTFLSLQSGYKGAIDAACASGCATCAAAGGTATCSVCPTVLRNRAACTYTKNDPSSCAAAGIVNAINSAPGIAWVTGP